MPRAARVVVPGASHHVTQRGSRRQRTFFDPADYRAYLRIAAETFADAKVEVWAYCLMPNQVHLIETPETEAGLAQAVGLTHQRYTALVNRRHGWSGYLWQGRFASSAMDEAYLRLCARYVGLNPVRAGLVRRAIDWPWSSVRAHRTGAPDPLLTPAPLIDLIGDEMPSFLDLDVEDGHLRLLRAAIHGGRPSRRWGQDWGRWRQDEPRSGASVCPRQLPP